MSIAQPKIEPWSKKDIVCPNCGCKDVKIFDEDAREGHPKRTVMLWCDACHTHLECDTLYELYKLFKSMTTMHREECIMDCRTCKYCIKITETDKYHYHVDCAVKCVETLPLDTCAVAVKCEDWEAQ